MLNNIQSTREFVIDLELSICFETNGPCEQTVTLASDVRIPYPACNNISTSNPTQYIALYKGKLYWEW